MTATPDPRISTYRKNSRSFEASEDWLLRAERTIPLGSQTFSKSRTQLPHGVSPYFATHGEGAHLFDIDGNRYVDYVCSLGAITLGYNDPDVNAAVHAQVDRAVVMSLAGREEALLAEAIVDWFPCAEKVRFGKNGSDATAGCVRLARAHTGRSLVAVCGYHGWQDWYIGSTSRHLGVPPDTRALTKTFAYNDIASVHALFKAHPGEIAAVILEPVAFTEPKADFLHELKALAAAEGAVLIFDEVVTGFRYQGGSAQALYGVVPDLSSIGKGMANGYPISAVVGRADIMALMEEVFFSFTMGGELVSIAAARATIAKMRQAGVADSVAAVGTRLIEGFRERAHRHGLADVVAISGQPSWSLVTFKDQPNATSFELKTLFMQECFQRGVFFIGIHFLSFAHHGEHVDATLAAYEEVFALLRRALDAGDVRSHLRTQPLVPLFKVR